MVKNAKSKVATEKFVWQVVNNSENRLSKRLDKIEKKLDIKFDKALTQLDSIAGQFKKFDEEQIILSAHSKNHTDKIERLEKKVFGTVQA